MEKGLISVILPIYNVEKYLDRCVTSVVNQTYRNLEIILVDDGSKDTCYQKCEQWAHKDSRIRVIHKKNEGLGKARNTGISNANGEYICFFDSDDFIETETIEKAYNAAVMRKAEIVVFGYNVVNREEVIKKTYVPSTNRDIYTGDAIRSYFLPNLVSFNPITGENCNMVMSAWSSLFSMELINRCGFEFVSEREIIAEDVYSLLVLYSQVSCVTVVNEALYNYCENETSLTHTYRDDRYEKIKKFHIESVKLVEKLQLGDEIVARLSGPFTTFVVAAMKMIVGSDYKFRDKYNAFNKVICDPYLQKIVCSMNNSKENCFRKLIYISIKSKNTLFCYALVKIRLLLP